MRDAFEVAAFRAVRRAQRCGASFEESPFSPEAFPELARYWSRGWVTAVEYQLPLGWLLYIDPDEAYATALRVQQWREAA
ncbi:hypothetical protein [Paraburkholderia sp. 32]|uniref:hypothetical protein n=1 Tax=Paraburkholderia sp. 32 TaxID=2991057 RepID=UPI003D193183